MANRCFKTLLLILTHIFNATAKNDLKFAQIINIANQLPISDCKRLVASLNSEKFEFPDSATSAGKNPKNFQRFLNYFLKFSIKITKRRIMLRIISKLAFRNRSIPNAHDFNPTIETNGLRRYIQLVIEISLCSRI